jgi:hypothetical protein
VEKPGDINTESGDLAPEPEAENTHQLTSEPAAVSPAAEPAAVPVELWAPVEVGGGDVVMLCQFSEAHINLLRTRAEEQSLTLAELMPELLTRMCDNAWV